MKTPSGGGGKETPAASLVRVVVLLHLLITALYILHVILFSSPSCPPDHHPIATTATASVSHLPTDNRISLTPPPPPAVVSTKTTLQHVVFGIVASARLWEKRKEYIKIWWRPNAGMRGFVWLDRAVRESSVPAGLPAIKSSSDTSRLATAPPSASPCVSKTFRLGLPGVRWFVMGDDGTVFLPDNLLDVLGKLDHWQPYYIGSPSESHLQNIFFSYGMAFGGGGFAISQPLAARLEWMQDACIRRYSSMYGSDDRIQACLACRSRGTRGSTSTTCTATSSASSSPTRWRRSCRCTTSTWCGRCSPMRGRGPRRCGGCSRDP